MFPLENIRVIEMTHAMAGPYAAMVLADLGAEVIKVEPPGRGDISRGWKPPLICGESAYFLSVNKNKKSLTVDIRAEEGREIMYKLVEKSDVLLENFRPGVLRRYSLDYDSLKDINPSLIYCSISGYGQSGPYKDKPGFDLSVLATGGIMSITGEPGGSPVKFGVPIADIGAGMYAVIGILTKLLTRRDSGKGGFIDISMYDVQISWLTHQAFYYFAAGKDPVKMGSAHPQIVPYQAFKTADEWIVITVGSDSLWRRFVVALERPELAEDPRFKTNEERVKHRDILLPILEGVLKKYPRDYWLKKLEEYGVPAAPVNSVSEALNNFHTKARSLVGKIYSEDRDVYVPTIMLPIRFDNFISDAYLDPPILGRDTESILKWLGYDDENIKYFKDKGIV